MYMYTDIQEYLYKYVCMYACTHASMHVCRSASTHIHKCTYNVSMCHIGVFSRTIKSLVHALGANSSMTEPTINSTLYTFNEQVNFYDLQKMVLQFAICFVPTLGYTYMVYTLRISAQSTTKSMHTH